MKQFAILLCILLILMSCSRKIDTNISRGLVSFGSFPAFQNSQVIFRVQIELPEQGNPVAIEYKIKSDTELICSGNVLAEFNDDGTKVFYESGLVSVSVPQSKYSGKTLSVLLDPEFKNTLPVYKDSAFLNYRMEVVSIP